MQEAELDFSIIVKAKQLANRYPEQYEYFYNTTGDIHMFYINVGVDGGVRIEIYPFFIYPYKQLSKYDVYSPLFKREKNAVFVTKISNEWTVMRDNSRNTHEK